MAVTRTYQEALQNYVDIHYAIRVNGEDRSKYEKELQIIHSILDSNAAKIQSDAMDTDKNGKPLYPNATLYFMDRYNSRIKPQSLLELETALFEQVANSNALKEKEFKKESKAGLLAGLSFIMKFCRDSYGGSETDRNNYDNAIKIMAKILQSNDPNIKARALEILDNPRNGFFKERYQELQQSQKEKQQSSSNIQSPPSRSSTARIEVKKTTALEFLEYVKSKIDNLQYTSKGFFDPTSSTIENLKKALRDLNNVKDIQELTKIYSAVRTIIEKIKEPDRVDKLEEFYATEKENISKVQDDGESKLEYLRQFFYRMEDYSNLKKGGGEPKNITILKNIRDRHVNDGTVDASFAEVKMALGKIEPERPVAIRNLFNDLKTKLDNSKKPNQEDQARLQQASRHEEHL